MSFFQKIGIAVADAAGAVVGGLIGVANPGFAPAAVVLAAGASWFAKSAFQQYNDYQSGGSSGGGHSSGSGISYYEPGIILYPEIEDTSSLGLLHNEILMEMFSHYEIIEDFSLSQDDQLCMIAGIASQLNVTDSLTAYETLDANVDVLNACSFDGMGQLTVPEYYSCLMEELPEYSEALSIFEPIAIGLNSVPAFNQQEYVGSVCSVILESSLSVDLKKILIDGIDVGVASSIIWEELGDD